MVIALNPPAVDAERDVVVDAAQRDRALVEAHRLGDPGAFATIVHLHHDMLWRLARRRLGNTFDAEDAVQETLLRAFRGLGRFGAAGDWRLAAWLTRIMANVCADQGNRRLAEASLADRMDPTDRPVGDAAELASDPVALTAVRAALGSLPLGQRQAFVLRAVDDLPYRDIADQLGISEENARARVQRARTALRHALDSGAAAAGALAAVPLVLVRRLHLGSGRATALLRRHGVGAAASATSPPTQTGGPLASGSGTVLTGQTVLSGPIAPLSTSGQLAAQAAQLAAQASASPIVQAAVAASSTAGGRGSLVMGLAASLATAGALTFPSVSGPAHPTSPAPSAHDAAAPTSPVDASSPGASTGSSTATGSGTSTANAAVASPATGGPAAPGPPASGDGGAGSGGAAAAAGPATPSWVQLVAAGAVAAGSVAAGGRAGTTGTAPASGQGTTPAPSGSGSTSGSATSPSAGTPTTGAASGSLLSAGSCAGIAGFPTLGTLPAVAPSGTAAISAMLTASPVNLTATEANPTFGGSATVAASTGLAGTSLGFVVGTCLARQGSEIAVQLDGAGGNEVLLYGSLVSAVPFGAGAPATPSTAAAPGTSTAGGLTYFFRGTVTQIGGVFDSQGTLPWGLGPQFVAELQIPEPANTGQLTVAFLDPQAGSTSGTGGTSGPGSSPATGSSGATGTTLGGGASGSSVTTSPAG